MKLDEKVAIITDFASAFEENNCPKTAKEIFNVVDRLKKGEMGWNQ
jgi:hypothetical protein